MTDYSVDDGSVPGRDGRSIPVRDYVPAGSSSKRPLVWLHGGGFTMGGLDQKESDAPARALAAAGRPVRAVDYRLAPSTPPWAPVRLGPHPGRFPTAHREVVDVVAASAERWGRAVHLGGASAGANLAAGAAMAIRDGGLRSVSSLVLAYGAMHAVLPADDDVERELTNPIARWAFGPRMYRRIGTNYVGADPHGAPGYAFPGGGDLTGLPPTLVLDARNDRIRRSGAAFADELRSADVEVEQVTVQAMHGFLGAVARPAFVLGTRTIAEWLDRHD